MAFYKLLLLIQLCFHLVSTVRSYDEVDEIEDLRRMFTKLEMDNARLAKSLKILREEFKQCQLIADAAVKNNRKLKAKLPSDVGNATDIVKKLEKLLLEYQQKFTACENRSSNDHVPSKILTKSLYDLEQRAKACEEKSSAAKIVGKIHENKLHECEEKLMAYKIESKSASVDSKNLTETKLLPKSEDQFKTSRNLTIFPEVLNKKCANSLLEYEEKLKACENRSISAAIDSRNLTELLQKCEDKLNTTENRSSSAEVSTKELEKSLQECKEKFKDCEHKHNSTELAADKFEESLHEYEEKYKACTMRSNPTNFTNQTLDKSVEEYIQKFELCQSRSNLSATTLQKLQESLHERQVKFEACEKRSNITELRLHKRWEMCKLPRTCAEVFSRTPNLTSGIYKISLHTCQIKPFDVYCRLIDGHAWTVIMRRESDNIDFNRNWKDYKKGFGPIDKSFFIGLRKLHLMTGEVPQQLLITLKDYNGNTRTARYDKFAIGSEYEKYNLRVLGNYKGDAVDSLTSDKGAPFSTKDHDNTKKKCSRRRKGGWWYQVDHCGRTNLHGKYGQKNVKGRIKQQVTWMGIGSQYYSLRYAEMAIRPA